MKKQENMRCLVVAATTLEIQPFLDSIRGNNGVTERVDPDILITGIGLTAATYHLTRQLSAVKYDLVIQAGIAGCFNKELSPGEVVVVDKDAIADQGVVEGHELKSIFDLGLQAKDDVPYKDCWLINPNSAIIQQTKLRAVTGISVNEISTDVNRISWYQNRFAAVTESMEGAALHYVCLMQHIPFVQLRAVSNYVGERDKSKWTMRLSIVQLNHQLQELIALL